MPTIYLSSTYEDLKDYRRAVFEALRKSGYQVIAMEDYVATDQRPVDKCLKDVEKADIYVGLFAFRYGYIPPAQHHNPNGLSITELEYRHAESCQKPCLTFVVHDSTAWSRMFDDAYTADDKGARIKALRQHLLTEKLASQCSEPHQLSALVLAAMTTHLATETHPASMNDRESDASAVVTWNIDRQGSPYPGLMHFTQRYAPVFFGRDAEVREILDRMRGPGGRFIIVSGDSGGGKSSIVDAGILARLEQGGLPGGARCVCVRMVPSQGKDPWSSLLAALGSLATRAGLRPDAIVEELNRSPDTLSSQIRKILKDGAENHALVLFLDQMEELFTALDNTKASQFLSALSRAAHEQTLWVLATIRSDQLHHCHRHPDMVTVLRGAGHYPVGPVESFMLTDMIVKPARCAGLRITDRLARRIVEETGTREGNLPLLGFVLEKLFEKRVDHELSEDLYQRLGGVAGAISAHVKTVEDKIKQVAGTKAERLLPDIFQTLARVQKEEGVPTRNRPLLTDFTAHRRTVVDLLVTERLLRTEGEGEAATVSLSHERLFEAWPALKEYVDTHKKVLVDRTLLESRARKWVAIGKPWFSGLASGREYQDFRRAGETASAGIRDYLRASRRARWIRVAAIAVLILVVGGPLVWLERQGVTLKYATSIVMARLHLASVAEPAMVTISGGSYQQGDLRGLGSNNEQPVRQVTIRRFAIGKYEVTFQEYDRYVELTGGRSPSDESWGREKRPVINVSWEDAVASQRGFRKRQANVFVLPQNQNGNSQHGAGEKMRPGQGLRMSSS